MKLTPTSTQAILGILLFVGFTFTSCKENKEQQRVESDEIGVRTADIISESYGGEILSLNSSANNNRTVSGNVQLDIEGNYLQITVKASGLEPNSMHLQHLHGFKDAAKTNCPDSTADKNKDGVVDVTEAAETAGITMIPFHDAPLNMKIKTHSYPEADENGNLTYLQTVNLDSLKSAFKENFDWDEIDFSKFTYMLHGVKEGSTPETAGSVMDVPAHVTLPVGCAKLSEQPD